MLIIANKLSYNYSFLYGYLQLLMEFCISMSSLLGTTMVIAGLYVFLWAKSKDLPGK